MSTKFVQCRNAKLKVAIDASATSAVFTEFVDLSGTPLTQADFGTTGYGTLEPNTDREEAISFTIDSNVAGEATLTLVRGLQGKAPYGAGGPTYAHQPQSELVISNNPDLLNKLTAKDNSEIVTGSWHFPETPTHAQNPVPKAYLENNAVMKTGDQTVAGVKTFSSSPVIPDATESDEPASKGQVDTLDSSNVKVTGNQTIAGVKTFSSSPKVPDATEADEPLSKGQYESDVAAASVPASTTVRGSVEIDIAADDVLNPEALTATAGRKAAIAGANTTPGLGNAFVTEGDLSDPTFKPPQVVTFTSSGTWTKDAGLKYVVVEVVGGGGGGGGTSTSGRGGGGGGAGGYARKTILASSLSSTETVTVGAGGAGGSGTGSAGGSTSFGSLLSATGGAGGLGNTSSASGGEGGVGSGGDINTNGGGGVASGSDSKGGAGGSSYFGGGAAGTSQVSQGFAGGLYGGGGGGAFSNGSAFSGNTGGDGIVIVTEHYS